MLAWPGAKSKRRRRGAGAVYRSVIYHTEALFSYHIGDGLPDLILDLSRGRTGTVGSGICSFATCLDQTEDPHLPVGVIEIAFAVVAGHRGSNSGHLIFCFYHSGSFQIGGERFAFEVDIGIDMVGNAAGISAETHASVERRVAKPYRPLFLTLIQHFPEAHMMAVVGAVADRLFECQIFAPSEIIKAADRCMLVGAIQQYAAGDLDRRSQRYGIGGIPAGRIHGAENVLVVADQTDIDRIAGNALGGPCHHRKSSKALLVFVMGP